MAEAAERAADASEYSLVVLIIAAFAAGAAAKYAKDAAKSTAEQVRVALQDSRPWLIIKSASVQHLYLGADDRLHAIVRVVIENVGRTPATDVVARSWPVFFLQRHDFASEVAEAMKWESSIPGLSHPMIVAPQKEESIQAIAKPFKVDLSDTATAIDSLYGPLFVIVSIAYRVAGEPVGLTAKAFWDHSCTIVRVSGLPAEFPKLQPADHLCNAIE
jgi:hypothetical protein